MIETIRNDRPESADIVVGKMVTGAEYLFCAANAVGITLSVLNQRPPGQENT